MKKIQYKIMVRLIKQAFIGLLSFSGSLASMANVSNFIQDVYLYLVSRA